MFAQTLYITKSKSLYDESGIINSEIDYIKENEWNLKFIIKIMINERLKTRMDNNFNFFFGKNEFALLIPINKPIQKALD